MSADEVYDRIQPHVRNIGTTGHGADCPTCRSFIGRSTHETELLDEVVRHLAEVATETEGEIEPLIHGVNFHSHDLGCETPAWDQPVQITFNPDAITCPACRDELVRK